ncbi:hypothetical protein ACQRIT_007453 [Beauveria bassiana]
MQFSTSVALLFCALGLRGAVGRLPVEELRDIASLDTDPQANNTAETELARPAGSGNTSQDPIETKLQLDGTANSSRPTGKAVEVNHANTVPGLNYRTGGISNNGLDGAAKANLMRREDPPELGNLDQLAKWLTNTPVRADCVFVTVAHLLGTTPEEVSRRTNVPIPQPGQGGTPEMLTILTKLGLVFRVWTYGSLPQGGGGPIRTRPLHPGRPLYVAFPRATGMPRTVGVAYYLPDATGNIRPDGNGEVIGHVVVCTNPGTPYARYVDYQADPNGLDITATMRNTRIAAYFSIDPNASTGDLATTQRPAIEQMEVDEERAHPETQYGESQLERPTTSQQEDSALDTSELMEVDEEHINQWSTGQFNGASCAAIIAAISAFQKHPRPGRSLPDVLLEARDKESISSDCDRAREMATQIQRPQSKESDDPLKEDKLKKLKEHTDVAVSLPKAPERWEWTSKSHHKLCTRLDQLSIDFELANNYGSGTWDIIKLYFIGASLKPHVIADGPHPGYKVSQDIWMKDIFGEDTVVLDQIKGIQLLDRLTNDFFGGDTWELFGIKLRGRCAGTGISVALNDYASMDKELQAKPTESGRSQYHKDWPVWSGNIRPEDWIAQPQCSHFYKINVNLHIADENWAGTNNDLYARVGESSFLITRHPSRREVFTIDVDVEKAFKTKDVPVDKFDRVTILSEGGHDAFLPSEATVYGWCSNSGTTLSHTQTNDNWVYDGGEMNIELPASKWVKVK